MLIKNPIVYFKQDIDHFLINRNPETTLLEETK